MSYIYTREAEGTLELPDSTSSSLGIGYTAQSMSLHKEGRRDSRITQFNQQFSGYWLYCTVRDTQGRQKGH